MRPVTAFDADVLIYAAAYDHPLGQRVIRLFPRQAGGIAGVGSTLLLIEVLAKPMREDPDSAEVSALTSVLGRLDLRPVDRLRAADAVHLATAVASGADRFLTNNRRDFPRSIAEIEIVYPQDLPEPS